MPSFARGSAVILLFYSKYSAATRNDDPFFDCDCDCDCDRSAERRRGAGIILVDNFACDALHDSIFPLAAGMIATTAALPSFVVVAVSSWWGWYHRTVCGQQSPAGHFVGCLLFGRSCCSCFYFFCCVGSSLYRLYLSRVHWLIYIYIYVLYLPSDWITPPLNADGDDVTTTRRKYLVLLEYCSTHVCVAVV